MSLDDHFDKLLGDIEELELTTVNGRITEIVGMLIKAIVAKANLCALKLSDLPAMK
jgi:type III secretion protein N (ATPase)